MASTMTDMYPLQYSVDYPEGPRNRLTTLVRLILAIPIIIISIFAAWQVIVPTFFMILFRNKYPRWWFDWNLEVLRFVSRVNSYVLLLRDEYPATDDDQAVHLDMPYPEEGDINRFMPIVKWILAIPHFIVLYVLSLIVLVDIVHRVAGDPDCRTISQGHVRLYRRRDALEQPRDRLRLRADHR